MVPSVALVSLVLVWWIGVLFTTIQSVQASTPWTNPTIMRCWTRGETVILYDPCPSSFSQKVSLTWLSIEPNPTVGTDMHFSVALSGQTDPESIEASLVFYTCRESAFDCDPSRQSKNLASFRLPTQQLATAFTNGTNATFTVQSQYAERHTFVAAAVTTEMIYFLGVARDVMSNKATGFAKIERASCSYTPSVGNNPLRIAMLIDKDSTKPGLQFSFSEDTTFLNGVKYQIHVHDTGDTRSFASALGHYVGNNMNPARNYETGMLVNSSFRVFQGSEPFYDPEVEFTGVASILGRSIVFHNAADGSRVAQCAIRPEDVGIAYPPDPEYLPVPDYDAFVCVFDNGDVIQMEVQDPLASGVPRIFVRYSLQNVTTEDLEEFTSVYLLTDGTPILAELERGKQVAKFTWTPANLTWYDLHPGDALVMASTDDSCIISRAARSGVFFEREFYRDETNPTPTSPAVTTASCMFKPTMTEDDEGDVVQIGVVGQIVFTRVHSSYCNAKSMDIPSCVRMDYFLSGLTSASAAVSIRQFGGMLNMAANELIPLFQGVTVYADYGCGDKPSCAKTIQPPSSTYEFFVNKGPSTASGVVFSSALTLNGPNAIVGRSLYVHSTGSANSSVVGQCIVAIDSTSAQALAPVSQLYQDTPDRAICKFATTDAVAIGQIVFTSVKNATQVKAQVFVDHNGIVFYNTSVILDFVELPYAPTSKEMGLRTVFKMTDPDILNVTVDALGNITKVQSLFGYTLGIFSDEDNVLMSSCVVGLAPATFVPTSVPTQSPIPAPTLPGGMTHAPSLRPPSKDSSTGTLSAGGGFILAVLLIVSVAFFCVVGTALKRRLNRQRESAYTTGINEWNYRVDAGDADETPPLKPIKPSAAKFSSLPDDDDFDERIDEEEKTAVDRSRMKMSSARSGRGVNI